MRKLRRQIVSIFFLQFPSTRASLRSLLIKNVFVFCYRLNVFMVIQVNYRKLLRSASLSLSLSDLLFMRLRRSLSRSAIPLQKGFACATCIPEWKMSNSRQVTVDWVALCALLSCSLSALPVSQCASYKVTSYGRLYIGSDRYEYFLYDAVPIIGLFRGLFLILSLKKVYVLERSSSTAN